MIALSIETDNGPCKVDLEQLTTVEWVARDLLLTFPDVKVRAKNPTAAVRRLVLQVMSGPLTGMERRRFMRSSLRHSLENKSD